MVKLRPKNLIPRGRARVRLVLVAVLLVTIGAALIDYPAAYNSVATNVNAGLERIDVPSAVEQLDPIGVFATIDRAVRLPQSERSYSLGLDLQGGVRLVYQADLSDIDLQEDRDEAVTALRDVVERRVNFLGVREPLVQVEQSSGQDVRLIVELAGIDDPDQAIEEIGKTPYLEFQQLREQEDYVARISAVAPSMPQEEVQALCVSPYAVQYINVLRQFGAAGSENPCFEPTELTGRYLEGARVVSDPTTGQLQIALQFDQEGAELFEELTAEHIGEPIAISLDGSILSAPTVNNAISGGQAVITGSFSLEEARGLASNLNAGALPVPIHIISQQQIGPTLGAESVNASLYAGAVGIVAVFIFMIALYRFSGVLAVLSLGVYLAFLLALIQLIPITLTLAGIAGLILSIGMAVDANVLVFERLREELQAGRDNMSRAVENSFARTWPAVRDGNISTLLTAGILFYFSTSFVQGFALTLGLGVLVSMFSAMVVTRYLMLFFATTRLSRYKRLWTRLLRV